MTNIWIGKIVNTHGIKGELRIVSDLTEEQKEAVFKIGSHLLVKGKSYEIVHYRVHKQFDMVIFKGYDDINQVLSLKGQAVYKEPADLAVADTEVFTSELLSFKVLTTTGKTGYVKAIEKTGKQYYVLRLVIDGKEVLLPYHEAFVLAKSRKDKTLTVRLLDSGEEDEN